VGVGRARAVIGEDGVGAVVLHAVGVSLLLRAPVHDRVGLLVALLVAVGEATREVGLVRLRLAALEAGLVPGLAAFLAADRERLVVGCPVGWQIGLAVGLVAVLL